MKSGRQISLEPPAYVRTAQDAGPYRDPDYHQLDSWIVVHENNTATFYVGKTDPGQGTGTGGEKSTGLGLAFDNGRASLHPLIRRRPQTDADVKRGASLGKGWLRQR